MSSVATVPTVYGIETLYNFLMCDFALPVATVPTVYGIETTELELHWSNSSCNSTYRLRYWNRLKSFYKPRLYEMRCNSTYRLRYWNVDLVDSTDFLDNLQVATVPTVYGIETLKMKRDRQPIYLLQQYLPFTVLKRQYFCSRSDIGFFNVATVPTVYGIETAYQNN